MAIITLGVFMIVGRTFGEFTHVIRDNRLLALSLNDKLGFGYDEGTNHIFSSCLSFDATTDRSYNLSSYTYLMDEGFDILPLLEPSAYRHEILRFIDETSRPKQEWDPELKREVNLKKVLFHVKMHSLQFGSNGSFFLRQAPRSLLQRGDWESFFRLCGTSFIHGFTKSANYLAVLTYRAIGKGDNFFLERLHQNLGRLYEPQVDDPDFERQLKRRRIRASDLSLGLPHQTIRRQSLDLEGFRKKLHSINGLMTHESAGLVETIEINPWHEFTDFVEHIPWENQLGWQHVSLLAQNGGFVGLMHVKEKNIKSRLKKAQLCSSQLQLEFPVGQEPGQYDPISTYFIHLKKPGSKNRISLKEFRNRLLEKDLVGQFKNHYQFFVNGDENENYKGLKACLRRLRGNYLRTYYADIPACVGAQSLPAPELRSIESYCLPQLATHPGN